MRNGHDRDAADPRPVEQAHHGEQVGRRLAEIARDAQIVGEHCALRHRGSEGQKALVGGDSGRFEAHRPGRRIVALELAGRLARGVAQWKGIAHGDGSDLGLDRLPGYAAGAQQGGRRGRKVEHRRLDADEAGPAVEDQRHARAQRLGHMLGARRADGAAAVGRGRGDRPAGGTDQGLRDGMRRRADRHGIETCGRQQGNGRAWTARQHQCEWPRPEPRRQLVGSLVPKNELPSLAGIEHVADQRIEPRPSLGLEDRRDRALVGGVGAQAIDRLGREGDEVAAAQQPCRLGDRLCRRRRNRHRAALIAPPCCGR